MKKLLILLFACALIAFLVYYFFFSKESLPKEIEEKVEKCLRDNPKASESYCRDVAFFELAIEEKDIGLCNKIKNSMLKNECIKAFK